MGLRGRRAVRLAALGATLIVGLWAGAVAGAARDDAGPWHEQDAGVFQDLAGVDFTDPLSGWIVGEGGTILATGDGGATWIACRSGTSADLEAVAFVDGRSGWAAGAAGVVLGTTDGGASWVRLRDGDGTTLTGLSFPTPAQGWAVGGDTILATTDGGSTWEEQETPGDGGYDLSATTFTDGVHGFAVGAAPSGGGAVLETTDGGATWSQVAAAAAELRDVAAAGAAAVWAAGDRGTVLVLDGDEWNESDVPGSPSLAGVVPLSATQATVVGSRGSRGAVVVTVDGGETWSDEATAARRLTAVDLSGARGCTVGDGGVVLGYDPSAAGATEAPADVPPAPPPATAPTTVPAPSPGAADDESTDWAGIVVATVLTMAVVGLAAFALTRRRG